MIHLLGFCAEGSAKILWFFSFCFFLEDFLFQGPCGLSINPPKAQRLGLHGLFRQWMGDGFQMMVISCAHNREVVLFLIALEPPNHLRVDMR